MSHLTDAIKQLEKDAQFLKDNLPNLDDPPTLDQLEVIHAFVRGMQERLDQIQEETAHAATIRART